MKRNQKGEVVGLVLMVLVFCGLIATHETGKSKAAEADQATKVATVDQK